MFYLSVICVTVYKKYFRIAWEKGTNYNCNASSTENKKEGGAKLQKAANNSE